MKAAAFFAAGASAAAIASIAYPVAVNQTSANAALKIRNSSPWYFIACYDLNYTGKCLTWAAGDKLCYNFSDDWVNQITSIKVDVGPEHECKIFEDKFCGQTGKTEVFSVRNSPDLRTSNMDDKAKSFSCRGTSRNPIPVE